MCRSITYFVVPSTQWLLNGDEKDAIIQAYKDKMRYVRRVRVCLSDGAVRAIATTATAF